MSLRITPITPAPFGFVRQMRRGTGHCVRIHERLVLCAETCAWNHEKGEGPRAPALHRAAFEPIFFPARINSAVEFRIGLSSNALSINYPTQDAHSTLAARSCRRGCHGVGQRAFHRPRGGVCGRGHCKLRSSHGQSVDQRTYRGHLLLRQGRPKLFASHSRLLFSSCCLDVTLICRARYTDRRHSRRPARTVRNATRVAASAEPSPSGGRTPASSAATARPVRQQVSQHHHPSPSRRRSYLPNCLPNKS